MLSSQELTDEMMTVKSDDEEYGYLIADIVDSYTDALFVFPKVGISSDMILIIKSTDAVTVKQALEDYKNERYEAYMGYAPLEANKINDGFVESCGDYVILVVLPDIESAQSLWNQAIAGE